MTPRIVQRAAFAAAGRNAKPPSRTELRRATVSLVWRGVRDAGRSESTTSEACSLDARLAANFRGCKGCGGAYACTVEGGKLAWQAEGGELAWQAEGGSSACQPKAGSSPRQPKAGSSAAGSFYCDEAPPVLAPPPPAPNVWPGHS